MKNLHIILLIFLAAMLGSCSVEKPKDNTNVTPEPTPTIPSFSTNVADFVQTSAAGDKFSVKPAILFTNGTPTGVILNINTNNKRQTIIGFGGSLTESSAYVLANLPQDARDQILNNYFTSSGANYDLTRTHIGSCNFTVKGLYSYDDTSNDINLTNFSIAPDKAGFSNVLATNYDLLPLIKDVLTKKSSLKIVASPWTAPVWMKQAPCGWNYGFLQTGYYNTFAQYMVKYIQAYQAEGVNIWAITPLNEPDASVSWEAMNFSAAQMLTYMTQSLGPAIQSNCPSVNILAWDYNRDIAMMNFLNVFMQDAGAAQYCYGVAVHWYASSTNVYTYNLDSVNASYPSKAIIHTEGCVDALSNGQAPLAWWNNDSWWWSIIAQDGSYKWDPADHPLYSPVHRYSRDIIEGLNHWLNGWIDWNIVLDKNGGPNHVGNICGAAVMVDTAKQITYYTPIFYVMSHFSRYIRPGDKILEVTTTKTGLNDDDFHATAAISQDMSSVAVVALNTTTNSITYNIQIGGKYSAVVIPANSVQSIKIKLSTL